MSVTKLRRGDWVEFYSGGHLVIDEVCVVLPRKSWKSYDKLGTRHHGSISPESVVRWRLAPTATEGES